VDIDLPDDLPLVTVDATFMDQILTNVIENALKYAPPPSPIRISARGVDDRVRLVIEDGGPGVPADSLPRLFEKFYRVARTGEGARRGTGVGLAVVRGLVETMGGAIVARPSALGGLALAIDLPVAAPDPAADDAPLTTAPAKPERSPVARG
jgi:K+-sensing histidine kinase KdpD